MRIESHDRTPDDTLREININPDMKFSPFTLKQANAGLNIIEHLPVITDDDDDWSLHYKKVFTTICTLPSGERIAVSAYYYPADSLAARAPFLTPYGKGRTTTTLAWGENGATVTHTPLILRVRPYEKDGIIDNVNKLKFLVWLPSQNQPVDGYFMQNPKGEVVSEGLILRRALTETGNSPKEILLPGEADVFSNLQMSFQVPSISST